MKLHIKVNSRSVVLVLITSAFSQIISVLLLQKVIITRRILDLFLGETYKIFEKVIIQ